MSLRKSPALTPALLAALRRNARKSTGPRTARGKAQSKMNAWRDRGRSRLRRDLYLALLAAPPGMVETWAEAIMTPEMRLNPVLRQQAEIMVQAEHEVADHFAELLARTEEEAKRGTNLRQTKLESH